MSVLPCCSLLLLLLCLPVLPEAKRQSGHGRPDKPRAAPTAPAAPAKRPRSRSVAVSGELSTKDGHRCSWHTSGEGLVSLLVNCSAGVLGEQRYWCRYAGKPDLCQGYGLKSSQYWKQLVGKLKKRQNACEGEKVLKAKTCKKAPAEAHMKLAQRSGGEEGKGGRGGGRKKASAASKSPEGGRAERRRKKEEQEKKKPEEQQEQEEQQKKKPEEQEQQEQQEQGYVSDMEPVQSYCSEGWNAVCSFFVKFFEG
ncbi:fibroblast growth factor-binding protein 2 [Betta splendens]|uniref:Fibroblast growth factor-binding protein 2 n=1 Tax=Betta splendens TaxID=158456 RepID=A0A6P7KSS5_BETSP|nr:fibroblast growth factor-binding protein 2 [Betta splendens]